MHEKIESASRETMIHRHPKPTDPTRPGHSPSATQRRGSISANRGLTPRLDPPAAPGRIRNQASEDSILVPQIRSHIMATALGRRLSAHSLLPGPGAQARSASAELKETTECQDHLEEQCERRPRKKRWLLGKMAITLGGKNSKCGVINSAGCRVAWGLWAVGARCAVCCAAVGGVCCCVPHAGVVCYVLCVMSCVLCAVCCVLLCAAVC